MKLSSTARRGLMPSQFALPAERKYPVPDKSHAANAKARATQEQRRGLLSPGQAATVKAKANAVLQR